MLALELLLATLHVIAGTAEFLTAVEHHGSGLKLVYGVALIGIGLLGMFHPGNR